MTAKNFRSFILASVGMSMLCSVHAYAQTSPVRTTDDSADIIITARKKSETSLSVPVVVSALGSNELKARAISNFDSISQAIPQLMIGAQGGSVQGGNVALRGIQGPDTNPFGDQTVSFNIDGVQIAKALVRKMGSMDIEQVEVLKGPQALFYGKNSPAGIVTLRTADPTKNLQVGANVGYEFNAREIRADGFMSAPITNTLGIRVAGYISDMKGYAVNDVPSSAYLYNYSDPRAPKATDWAARLTLKWEPTSDFDARLKVNFNKRTGTGPAATTGYFYCPFGAPQTGSRADCKQNGIVTNPGSGGGMVTPYTPGFRDGRNFTSLKQTLASLEMHYQLSDHIKLTSVTGFYKAELDQAQNYENDYKLLLPSRNTLNNEEWSQELRMETSYDGPLNLTAGGYYSSTRADTSSNTFLLYTPDGAGEGAEAIVEGTAAYVAGLGGFANYGLTGTGGAFGLAPYIAPNRAYMINHYFLKQKGKTYSGFAQVQFKPIEVIEIDLGGRYTHEEKELPVVQTDPFFRWIDQMQPLTNWTAAGLQGAKKHWNDFSPEASISYRPSRTLTVFGSYKHGFLSGGFNSGSIDPASTDNSYNPMVVEGFEAGLKTMLLDNRLRLNMAAYTYKISDMQVQYYVNATNSIKNAAAGTAKGFEVDFNYRTPVNGLAIHGSAAYNDAKFSNFTGVQCYNGQTVALGCNATTMKQDLSGRPVPRAPQWNLAGGFTYERPITSKIKLGLNTDVTHSTSYVTDTTANPFSIQRPYTLVDASLRLAKTDDSMEVALIGRNLTNEWFMAATTDVPFTGGSPITGALADRYGSVSRGREIMLRFSVKFGAR